MEEQVLENHEMIAWTEDDIREIDVDLIVKSILIAASVSMVSVLFWLFAMKDWVIVGM
jgi:hypothetical protein